ncbi:MAG: hypothetical protein JWP78_3693 [Mucilaginibacter sp.]|nr:hypothetical protein [Mucilaginibacter sp.]
MTVNELYIKLKGLGIPDNRYYLHGLYGSTNDDDKLALVIKKGIHTIEYEVYYKERGEKHSVKVFATENDACQYVYKRLRENKEIEDKYSK